MLRTSHFLCLAVICFGTIAGTLSAAEPVSSDTTEPLLIVVMDPLSAPLSCPCVEGYAQRKYEVLAEHIKAKFEGREVQVVFGGSLTLAKKKLAGATPDLIIGKESVVRADTKKESWPFTAVARLTDKTGSTSQHGLIVVPSKSPAKTVYDLADYHIVFGPADCDEKHQAAFAILKKAGIPIPENIEVDAACSDGACRVVELGPTAKAAAVISSYAAPLLEGCGTIKKGDLRVVAKTAPVPFVTAFTNDNLSSDDQKKLGDALLTVVNDPATCTALESLIGFVPIGETAANDAESAKKK